MYVDHALRATMQILHDALPVPRPNAVYDDFDGIGQAEALDEEAVLVLGAHQRLLQEQDNLVHDGFDATVAFTDQFCDLIARGLGKPAVCKLMGIDPRKFHNAWQFYRKGEPQPPGRDAPAKDVLRWNARKRHWDKLNDFFVSIAAKEAELEGRLLDPQVKAATHPDTPDLGTGKWLLERRFGKAWGKVSNVRHEGKTDSSTTNNVKITQNVIATGKLSDAQLEAMERAHQAMAVSTDSGRAIDAQFDASSVASESDAQRRLK